MVGHPRAKCASLDCRAPAFIPAREVPGGHRLAKSKGAESSRRACW